MLFISLPVVDGEQQFVALLLLKTFTGRNPFQPVESGLLLAAFQIDPGDIDAAGGAGLIPPGGTAGLLEQRCIFQLPGQGFDLVEPVAARKLIRFLSASC